jgi:hypothetical protein
MTARSRIPAAATAWVGSQVAGPVRRARVVHRGADALYLDLEGSCLGVLSAAASAVPCALQTGLDRLPAELLVPDTAVVGEGRVLVGDHEVVVGRTVHTAVPRLDAAIVGTAQARLEAAVGSQLDAVRAELPSEALAGLAEGRADAVPALLGRGSGLTPLGDDVLAGWVATHVAAGAAGDGGYVADVLEAVQEHAHAMTTLLSATLLDCAARGDVLPQYRRLLLDLVTSHGEGVGESVGTLVRVGHTSGAGLTLGTVLALRHLASRSST